jgi:4-hydroxymandelate oxidase
MRDRIAKWEADSRARLAPEAAELFAAGSGDELSLAEASAAWDDWRFVPRVLRDVSQVDVTCELFGSKLKSPVVVAPMAYHALAHPEGELASAAGARQAGALYVMATRATRPLEEVAAVAGRPWWFQVYVLRDRGLTRALVERAVAAGAAALMLTGDTPIVGPKPRASGPVPLTDAQYLVNLGLHLAGASGPAVQTATSQDPSVTEEVVSWLADLSGLPVLVKGVLRADDARRCLDAGAAGLVVSNHGARQLDGAIATAHALSAVVGAVDGRAPVLVDGGILDGRAVLKALCLGASAVMVGRPVLWALAAGGAEAVEELLEGLRAELVESMMLAGARTIDECDRSLVEWQWRYDRGGPPV